MDHIFFIHLSVEEHLGSFHSLAIADIAAMNIGVHIWPFFSLHLQTYILDELLCLLNDEQSVRGQGGSL